jgi:hypothetical protein
MKKAILLPLLFSTSLMANDKTWLDIRNPVTKYYESVDLSVKNTFEGELLCPVVAINLRFTDPIMRREIENVPVFFRNVYLQSGQTFTKSVAKEMVDEYKQKLGLEYIVVSSEPILSETECHVPTFLEFAKLESLSEKDKKFLKVLKMGLDVNSLERLAEKLSSERKLHLEIKANELKKNPKAVSFAKEPMSLSLLRFFPNLESLTVRNLGVVDVSRIGGLNRLQVLDLAGNTELEDISEISKLGRLEKVNLSGTSVSSLESLKPLAGLKSLDISNSKVSDLGWLLEPNGVECAVFNGLRVRSDDKAVQDLIKRSKANIRVCDRY